MAEPQPLRKLAWDPATNPATAWAELRATAQRDDTRACLAAAERQADRVWIALHTGRLSVDVPATTVPARNADWYRLALSAYDVMHDAGAYRHLGHLQPRACAAAQPILEAWLNGPAPSHADRQGPHGVPETVAESLGVGHAVHHINAETHIAHLSTVVNAAQDAGVFGLPDHFVDLVTSPASSSTTPALRVVVDAPSGAAYASEPIELDTLLSPNRSGVEAITTALRRVADAATEALARHARAGRQAPPAEPRLDRVDGPTSRAFPELRVPAPMPQPDQPPSPDRGSLSPLGPDTDDNGPSRRRR
jgi:hypothetical protein